MSHIYDVLIIGGGPAGYTAALYASRAGLDTLVLEKLSAGGQIALTDQVDNYPGFSAGIDGWSLATQMQQGAERFGAKTRMAEVTSLKLEGAVKEVVTSEGSFFSRTVMLATGANPRPLGVPREKELTGRGIHYCATCDGMFYRGKTVAVVGGGNTAVEDVMVLSRIAEKVILVHRRDSLRATKVYLDHIAQLPNVEFRWNSTVEEVLASPAVTGMKLRDVVTGAVSEVPCDGVFVSIGRAPATQLVDGLLELDGGYIAADESTRTSIPGVYALGDVRTKEVRQVVTAVADGAVAVHYAEAYLADLSPA